MNKDAVPLKCFDHLGITQINSKSYHSDSVFLRKSQTWKKQDVHNGLSSQGHRLSPGVTQNGIDARLGCQFIRNLAASGNLIEAHNVFKNIGSHNVFTWNAIISAYARHGRSHQVLQLYFQMMASHFTPSSHTFVAVLKACSSILNIDQLKRIHDDIVKYKLQRDVYVGSVLIEVYAKLGCLDMAQEVFSDMDERDVYCWYAIISAHANVGDLEKAFQLYSEMNVQPSNMLYVCLLNACGDAGALKYGKLIHVEVVKQKVETTLFVGSSLIDMYCKCGEVDQARNVFNEMREKNVITWSAMISGYSEHSEAEKAMQLFKEMQQDGIKPDSLTFISTLKACSALTEKERLTAHASIIEHGLESDVYLGNNLVDMYAKHGSLDQAKTEFCKLYKQDVVSWNAIISGCVQHGYNNEAFQIYEKMQQEGLTPDNVTYIHILKACASLGDLEKGKWIHSNLQKHNLVCDPYIVSALIQMYSKCGSLGDAHKVFNNNLSIHDVVSWSTMIAACVENCCWREAIILYRKMREDNVKPDKVTLVWLLKTCYHIADGDLLQMIHHDSIYYGNYLDLEFSNNLIDAYSKCRMLEHAIRIFNSLIERDVVTWNVIIGGTVENLQFITTLELFKRMQQEHQRPDNITFTLVLQACTALTDLNYGRSVHSIAIHNGLDLNKFVGSSLVHMYSKCGNLEDSHVVFNKLDQPDAVTWSAIIGGFAQHGHLEFAFLYFRSMLAQGIHPDSVTFTGLLSACSHAGLVKEGLWIFKTMVEDYGLVPSQQHYICVIDLLARAGCLLEAQDFITELQLENCSIILTALLAACAKFGDIDMGQKAFESLIKHDPENSASYNLISSVYLTRNPVTL